jgi:hypothetical protein
MAVITKTEAVKEDDLGQRDRRDEQRARLEPDGEEDEDRRRDRADAVADEQEEDLLQDELRVQDRRLPRRPHRRHPLRVVLREVLPAPVPPQRVLGVLRIYRGALDVVVEARERRAIRVKGLGVACHRVGHAKVPVKVLVEHGVERGERGGRAHAREHVEHLRDVLLVRGGALVRRVGPRAHQVAEELRVETLHRDAVGGRDGAEGDEILRDQRVDDAVKGGRLEDAQADLVNVVRRVAVEEVEDIDACVALHGRLARAGVVALRLPEAIVGPGDAIEHHVVAKAAHLLKPLVVVEVCDTVAGTDHQQGDRHDLRLLLLRGELTTTTRLVGLGIMLHVHAE